jgi:hypothetical protein
MRAFLFLMMLFYGGSLYAQILDNSQCSVFTDDPFFNAEFIRNNKIKSIRGDVSTKSKNSAIVESNTEYIYEFDIQGRLIKKVETFFLPGSGKDTSVVYFEYDDRNNLILRRKNDGYGFFSFKYTYDDENRITSMVYCREENASDKIDEFVPGKTYIISKESYVYDMLEEGLRRKVYNNYDKLYQETMYYQNELGYIISEETRLLVSNNRSVVEYMYDNKGRPSAKFDHKSVLRPSELAWHYEYDEVGNVLKEEYYRNEVFITRKEAVYHPQTMLLKALIKFDIATEFMHIVRFSYGYY